MEPKMNWHAIREKIIGSNDYHIVQNYCSPITMERLSGYENLKYFRLLISTLSELLPDAPHDTPGWSSGPYPVIAIGSAESNGLGLRINRPRFGLCLEQDDLKIWSDGDLGSALKATTKAAEWKVWRDGEYFSGNALEFIQRREVGDILKSHVQNADVKMLSVARTGYRLDIPLLYPLAIHMANRAENYRKKEGFGS
jgi:hypothetical protein